MKNTKIEFKWAIFFSVMMLLWMTMEMLTRLHDENIADHPIYTNLVAIPAILIYIFALRDKKKNFFEGNMTYKQSFLSAMVMTIIITMLSPICLFVSMTYISPDYFTNAIHHSVENELSTLEEATAYFNLNSYLLQSIIGSLIMGILTGAIVSLFVKSKQS